MAYFKCTSTAETALPDSFSINVNVNASAEAQHDTGNRNASVRLGINSSGTIMLGKDLYDYVTSPSGIVGGSTATNIVSVSRTVTITFTRRI